MEITNIIFWVLVALFVAPTFYFGYLKVVAKPDKVKQFAAWGYPVWLMQFLGFMEIVAAFAIIFPQTRLLGIVIWAIILSGAIYTNLFYKEPRSEVITAVSVLGHLIVIFALTFYIK